MRRLVATLAILSILGVPFTRSTSAAEPLADSPPILDDVEAQPLAAQIKRLVAALELLGAPLPADSAQPLAAAIEARDATALQKLVDRHALLVVSINPESRVKVRRGPAGAELQQGGFMPVLMKIINESTSTAKLKLTSPQGGARYAGASKGSLSRQQQTTLNDQENTSRSNSRFLALALFDQPPMLDRLSGLKVEYAIGLIYSADSGKREATIGVDLGQGNQDLGFRGETPILFEVRPAVPVKLSIRDADATPTIARLEIRDRQGRVYPPQALRIAPDLFFQPHIYRTDGETLWLPPGGFVVESSRGPEYVVRNDNLHVAADTEPTLEVRLQRWVQPRDHGFYSGDHHIHGAGCAHYTVPTEGITPLDMFRQVKGEGLNVGCVLTWGPCFRFQRQFFETRPHDVSEPLTLLKYDLEISGFGSQALGHVCLLNLRDQTYPGSDGLETKGWPTWTTPVMRWAKDQGGFAGYAHSASGLAIDPAAASRRMLKRFDASGDSLLSAAELHKTLLPEPFAKIDANADSQLAEHELVASHDRAADQLPNLAIPEMNGVGAMEICVSTAAGVCDFISAMDTRRIQEWNTWYHLLNCGFPLKVSGETDFPCMSSRRVGQGRVYVRLGEVRQLDYAAWCAGLAAGRSYVSDGFAHALDFQVGGQRPGPEVLKLDRPGPIAVQATVSFAPLMPRSVAHGTAVVPGGPRMAGDTVELHVARDDRLVEPGPRQVELLVNGQVVARRDVPADGRPHKIEFTTELRQSSWVALRHFPQLHTNPVTVEIGGRPVRASRDSARWCIAMTELLWTNREKNIAPAEREAAREAFDAALKILGQRAEQSSPSDRR